MMKIETKLAQLGNRKDKVTGAIVTPIYLSTAYAHPGLGESTGYDYTRTKNPTRTILEEGLCELEEGCRAIVTSSGMSAIQLVFELFELNSEFLVSRDLYGGSFRYFDELERKGAQKFVYFTDEEDLEVKITENTKAVFIETPTNPLMQEVDIEKIAKIAKEKNALLIVDNTLLTPLRQKPLTIGADIVVHSATKYLTGHNDILAGAVITNNEEVGERLAWISNTTGAVLSSFDSWLFIRSLKTLPLRFNQQEKNALLIVDNTLLTPLRQKPLTIGADIVVHSATKYLTGHNDILAGAVITNNEEVGERLSWISNTTGAVLSAFDSWLFIRSLKTLPLRFNQQEKNAMKLAKELEKNPNVKEVLYPNRGAMLSFKLHDASKIDKFLRSLKIAIFAESLGGVETLVTYPTTQTHFDIPEELRLSYGLTPDLLRISVGIEDIEDLLEDFTQALEV